MKRICSGVITLLLLVYLPFSAFSQKGITSDTLKKPLSTLADEYKKYLPNFSPLSPNAAGMQKYGDFQVNLATGIPDISIPIYTVQDGKLSLPIVLRNHASGHPLSEFASWVGWGWSLDYGGSVNRTINGLADDKPIPKNYLKTTISAWNLCNNVADYSNAIAVNTGSYDLEPDLFTYSTPEVSGKFYLRQDGQPPFLIPFQPVKITNDYTTIDTLKTFQIIAPSGNEYVFGGSNSLEYQSVIGISAEPTLNGAVTWQLSKILSPNTDDEILLSYQDGGSIGQYASYWSASATFNGGVPVSLSTTPFESQSFRTNTAQNIHKITFSNGEIEFIQSNVSERLDLSNSPFLKEINVYNYENNVKTLLKKFVFRYSYFLDRTGANGRLKLDKLVEFNANSSDSLVHLFEYFTNSYSWKIDEGSAGNTDLLKQDYFGFFNGKINNHLIDISSYNGVTILGGVADRSTVTTYMKEGVLSKITYPTGGFTTFDFEVNKYKQLGIEKLAGGLRIKGLRNFTGIGSLASMKRYEYSSDDGLGIGKLTNTWSSPSSGMVGYINNAVGDQLHKTDFIGSNGMAEMGSFEGTPIYYTTVKEFADSVGFQNGYSEYEFSFEPDVNVVTLVNFVRDIEPWKRGLLLSQKTYNSTGVLVQNVVNTYQQFKQQLITNIAKVNLINNANINCLACPSNMPTGFFTPEGLSTCGYPQFNFFTGNNKTGQMKLVGSESTIDGITNTQSIYYDDNLLPTKTISDDSKANSFNLKISVFPTHSSYDTNPIALNMRSRNMIGVPLESIEKDSINGVLATIFHQKTIFDSFTGSNSRGLANNILPKEIWVALGGTPPTGITLEKRVEFTNYDVDGNPTEYKVDGIPTALIWGYGGSLLLGQVQNNTISNVEAAMSYNGITTNSYSVSSLSDTQLSDLQTLRNILPNSLVTWYVHRPQVGVAQIIAPNGLKTGFVYDNFQRLKFTKDHSNFITNKYEYIYKNSSNPYNKVIQTSPRTAISDENQVFTYSNAIINHQYFDELGRSLQTIGVGQSPNYKSIVSNHVKYDPYGRKSTVVAPAPLNQSNEYFAPDALQKAKSFYADDAPIDSTIYESSPLNRAIQIFGVGKAWRVANRKTQIFYENAGAEVRDYTTNLSGDILLNGTYPANSLYKKRIIDEQGNTSIEISDKRGRLIQKQVEQSTGDFLTTYYINDGLGRPLAILQPEGYELNAGITKNSTEWQRWVFTYEYDYRGRMRLKHVPASGDAYFVYDKWDRLVWSQTALQREAGKWTFYKYDAFNREILRGEKSEGRDLGALESETWAWNGARYEDRVNNGIYYSISNSYPPLSSDADIRHITYYDTYSNWVPGVMAFADGGTAFHAQHPEAQGWMVGSRSRNSLDNSWLVSAVYYDNKGRTIRTFAHNLYGQIEMLDTEYSHVGEILRTKKIHKNQTGVATTEQNQYELDHVGRVRKVFHGINTTPIEIVKNDYDQIGRLSQKKIFPNNTFIAGGTKEIIERPLQGIVSQPNTVDLARQYVLLQPTTDVKASNLTTYLARIDPNAPQGITINGLQTINFAWHIRGGLLGINLDNNGNATPNTGEGDLFSYKLEYESASFYDGNIGKQSWQSANDQNQAIGLRSYTFDYDAAKRLKDATFTGINGENYGLRVLQYDKNGNIGGHDPNAFALERYGKTSSGYGLIDRLKYSYEGNRLSQVSDAVTTLDNEVDLVPRDGGNYTYYSDGSLKSDENEGISLILYDTFLKQPREIQLSGDRKINYYYDGAGALLKTVYSTGEYWEYAGIIYKNGGSGQTQPYQMASPEGRAVYVGGSWQYEFFYTDHLGNTRVGFRAAGGPSNGNQLVKTSETAFDPWGVVLRGAGQVNATQNRWEYQGKEKESTFGLNRISLGARTYNPTTGRMDSADPLAHVMPSLTAYRYAFNNPVNVTDPTGLFEENPNKPDFTYSDGYSTLSSRNTTGSVGFEGMYNAVGGDGDKKKNAVAPVIPNLPKPAPTTPSNTPKFNPTPWGVFIFLASILQGDDSPTAPSPVDVGQKEENKYIYREMATNPDGSWMRSPLIGAPNGKQMGARTPASILPLGNKNPKWDIEPQGPNNMVGPSFTGLAGLSASYPPRTLQSSTTIYGRVKISNLPPGLGAINDGGNHYSIFPATNMTFSVYQTILNRIPWTPIKP